MTENMGRFLGSALLVLVLVRAASAEPSFLVEPYLQNPTPHGMTIMWETLDGDNRLDVNVGTAQEDFRRYVFPVGSDEFFVRDGVSLLDGAGRELRWRLYRIPFRADTLQVGQPNLRQVESMRLTK